MAGTSTMPVVSLADRELGLHMAALIAASGRSEADVATSAGMSQSYVSRLLHGNRRWTPALWRRVAWAIDGCTLLDMDCTDEQLGSAVRTLARLASQYEQYE